MSRICRQWHIVAFWEQQCAWHYQPSLWYMTDAAQNQAQIVFFKILPSSLVCHIQLTKISSQHLYHSRLATDVARDKVTELSNMRRPCQSSLTAATRPQTSDTHRHIAITGQHTEYVTSRHDQTHAVCVKTARNKKVLSHLYRNY